MPTGDNPKSKANLKRYTPEEARYYGKIGAQKSAETRRKLKTFKEIDDEYTTDAERKKMVDMLKRRAMQGNLKALELYRDTMGMKPAEKIEQTSTDIIIDFSQNNDND